MKKIIYQKHHPDRENHPNYTIKLRRWAHLYLTRLNQLKPTKENLDELSNVKLAVDWIYLLKHREYKEELERDKKRWKDWHKNHIKGLKNDKKEKHNKRNGTCKNGKKK